MKGHLTDELAQRLVDAAMPAQDEVEWRAHAAGCPPCAALLRSYRALGSALAGLGHDLLPPDFTASVMSAIDARERARSSERRLAVAILAAAAFVCAAVFAAAGASGFAAVLSRLSAGVGGLARTLVIGVDVLSPLVRALRLQIALGCAALGLPILFALSRLVPRRASAG